MHARAEATVGNLTLGPSQLILYDRFSVNEVMFYYSLFNNCQTSIFFTPKTRPFLRIMIHFGSGACSCVKNGTVLGGKGVWFY
jgi:hypothetical protein